MSKYRTKLVAAGHLTIFNRRMSESWDEFIKLFPNFSSLILIALIYTKRSYDLKSTIIKVGMCFVRCKTFRNFCEICTVCTVGIDIISCMEILVSFRILRSRVATPQLSAIARDDEWVEQKVA